MARAWPSAARELGSTTSDSLLVWPAGGGKATLILTVAKLPITSVAWTPKASQIAYAVAQSNGLQSSLWIVNADGSNRHLLLANGSYPAWAIAPVRSPERGGVGHGGPLAGRALAMGAPRGAAGAGIALPPTV